MQVNIEVVENGFVLAEDGGPATVGKQWVFESAATLANFVEKWAKDCDPEKPADDD